MTKELHKAKSRYLCFLLRHNPGEANLDMDGHGWVCLDQLMENTGLTQVQISEIVETDKKQRYKIDSNRIRANQGHSIDIELELEFKIPPEFLYHGTSWHSLSHIMLTGISKCERNHVHLSTDFDTAISVGARHGRPAVLKVHSSDMAQNGYEFYISENLVWLTDSVPAQYLTLLKC